MPKRIPKSAPALAESPELPQAPPKPEIEQVLLRDITPSLYQPRRFPMADAENPKLLDLARSIRAKGVIQPILLRPIESGYEIVVGECRVRASRLDLPELDAIGPRPFHIPAILRALSDTEAAELTVEENIRRQDLTPLEEAAGVHTLLLLHRGDTRAVAARLGQPAAWVACRARIHSNLSENWKELLANPEGPFRSWTTAHVEQIAKLAPEVQDEILEDRGFDHVDVNISVPELRHLIAELTRKLGRPWECLRASHEVRKQAALVLGKLEPLFYDKLVYERLLHVMEQDEVGEVRDAAYGALVRLARVREQAATPTAAR